MLKLATGPLNLTPEQFWELCPFEFQLLYDGYVFRRKENEYRTAWALANILNAWRGKDDKAIKVSTLLPWAKEDELEREEDIEREEIKRRKKSLKSRKSSKPRDLPKQKSIDELVDTYLITAGKKKEDLTPEELAEIRVNAINQSVANEVDAPGLRLFRKAPKEWCNFPD